MAIPDETVGPMNWQRHHTMDNQNCIVSIWDEDKKKWIRKEDTGTESYTENDLEVILHGRCTFSIPGNVL